MRNYLIGLFATLALFGAVLVVADSEPASAAPYNSCGEVWDNFASNVCFDVSQDRFHIYTDSGYWGTFPSNGGNYTGPQTVWGANSWHMLNSTQTYGLNASGGYFLTSQEACYDAGDKICVYGGNHDYLEWFAASAGFEMGIVP